MTFKTVGGIVAGTVALATVGMAGDAFAAGFQLREQSSESIGNAFAGSAAKALTAATVWYNPAGMTLLDGNQIAGSTTWIAPRAEFSGSGTGALHGSTGTDDGGDAIRDAAVGAVFGVWSWSKDLKFGLAVTSPFGLRSSYPDDWTGRYQGLYSSITNINVNPNVAWRVNSNLSIGAGIQVAWINAKLTSAVDQNAICYQITACRSYYGAANLAGGVLPDGSLEVKGDHIGVGYNLGLLWEFSPTTRVGLAYRSEIQNRLEGDATTTGSLASAYKPSGSVYADFTTPATATLSLYHEIDPQWAVMADVQWTGWSVLKDLTVHYDNGTVLSSTNFDWRDTWFFSVGANYLWSPGHKLHFGVAYDMSAVRNESLRGVRVPDADRIWLATGYTWDVNDKVQWNIGYAHIFAMNGDVALTDPTTGTLSGHYDASVDMVSTSMVYKF